MGKVTITGNNIVGGNMQTKTLSGHLLTHTGRAWCVLIGAKAYWFPLSLTTPVNELGHRLSASAIERQWVRHAAVSFVFPADMWKGRKEATPSAFVETMIKEFNQEQFEGQGK